MFMLPLGIKMRGLFIKPNKNYITWKVACVLCGEREDVIIDKDNPVFPTDVICGECLAGRLKEKKVYE